MAATLLLALTAGLPSARRPSAAHPALGRSIAPFLAIVVTSLQAGSAWRCCAAGYEVRLAQGRHDAFGDPVVVGAARVQHALVAALDAVGPGVLAVALLVLLLVAAVLAVGPRPAADGVGQRHGGPPAGGR